MPNKLDILEITDKIIVVDTGKEDIEINKDAFENWIDNAGKRAFPDKIDFEGEYHPQVGLLDWSDYYDSHYFKSDIIEYLKVRDAKTGKLRDMYDLGAGLKKLLTK